MNNKISLFFLVVILVTISACNRNGAGTANFNSIVYENAVLEKVTEGYDFDTAGSPLYMNGDLYFTNNNFDSPGELSRTFRMNPDGSIDTLMSGNNVTTTLRASGQGTIYACEMLGHRVVELDQNSGALEEIQRISMLPEGYDGNNSAADIHLSPNGRFLYASNRGHDSLVIYGVDEETGTLRLVGHESTRGSHPRNFMMDQMGEYVLVANRDNDNVVVFNRNIETGQLTYSGEQVSVPMAVCVTHHIIRE